MKDITLGFELECGVYTNQGVDELETSPYMDDVGGDGSLSRSYEFNEMVEGRTVAMPYSGQSWRDYLKWCQSLQDNRVIGFNDTCGLHFHISFGDSFNISYALSSEVLLAWVNKVKKDYPELYRARRDNSYCRTERLLFDSMHEACQSRYRPINAQALYRDTPTLECRFYGAYRRNDDGLHVVDFSEYERFVSMTVRHFRQAINANKFDYIAEVVDDKQMEYISI